MHSNSLASLMQYLQPQVINNDNNNNTNIYKCAVLAVTPESEVPAGSH